MARCPLSVICPQPAVLAVKRGFLYAPGGKAFLCSPTKRTVEKTPHNLWIFILELCFGLPLMPLPLQSAVSRAVGPLGEAGLVAVLLVGGRKEAVPQPSLSSWLEVDPRKKRELWSLLLGGDLSRESRDQRT